jgi:hypothetical protein
MDERTDLQHEARCRIDRPDISASEVADYAFCARSWWLRRTRGVMPDSEALRLGVVAHEAVGRRVETVVDASRTVKGLLWLLAGLALALLLVLVGQ